MIILNDIEIGWNGNRTIINTSLQRNNIYAGMVAQCSKIYPIIYYEGHRISLEKAKQLGMEIPNNVQNYRKILFTKNKDNTINDLMYDSPNYTLNDEQKIKNGELYIDKIVCLGKLLKEHGFSNYLDKNDIKKIYKTFLKKNNKFLKEDYLYLPITNKEFENLKFISELSRIPSENVLNRFNKDVTFEPKIKIFTKK
ncbi:MAG: hypothetical protein IJO32_02545 [Bacilli bacterium]|nr:hypothetical protein [Bacilli bacterium]